MSTKQIVEKLCMYKGTFFLAYSGLVYAAGRKKKQKNTEHERVQFLGTTEHEMGPYTHATRQKHTLNTRGCSFEYH